MRSLLLVAVFIVCPAISLGQGCTQCRDNTAATPPATRIAYRRAILLLVSTGAAIFASTIIVLKRSR